ncbi:DUF3995 domain-containing protein [Yoonia sp. BS5-3]|uniref:DUF3995 domain-containing protein n=1 Tax=Yoonia phaeophyticola TaxID=3137369 RepID=A0ABZ2V4F6_9RHOB
MTALLTGALVILAVIHALWGLEIWVPIRDEARLARTVVGARGVTRMPGAIPCFLVGLGLLIIAIALWFPQVLLGKLILWGAAAVLMGRGGIAYTRFWRKMTPEQPFATYDKKYYAPLCLLLGGGIVFVLLRGI